MASLKDYEIQTSYKDLLTVLDANAPNSGIESTVKRVFDGEGTSSPLFLSSTSVEISGNLTVTGQIINGQMSTLFSTDGKVTTDTAEMSLWSDSKELLKIKNDGTTRLQSVSSAPNSPAKGDMVNLNGVLYIAID